MVNTQERTPWWVAALVAIQVTLLVYSALFVEAKDTAQHLGLAVVGLGLVIVAAVDKHKKRNRSE